MAGVAGGTALGLSALEERRSPGVRTIRRAAPYWLVKVVRTLLANRWVIVGLGALAVVVIVLLVVYGGSEAGTGGGY